MILFPIIGNKSYQRYIKECGLDDSEEQLIAAQNYSYKIQSINIYAQVLTFELLDYNPSTNTSIFKKYT